MEGAARPEACTAGVRAVVALVADASIRPAVSAALAFIGMIYGTTHINLRNTCAKLYKSTTNPYKSI